MIFVGAGLSCSYTLLHYMNLAEALQKREKVKLLVLDKQDEFWTGIPYGPRSGFGSLTITSLKEFLPDNERELFITWLEENVGWVGDRKTERGIRFSAGWLKDNETYILSKSWEKMFLPRHVFGVYLKERVKASLDAAVKKGTVEYRLVTADVKDICRMDEGYEVRARTTADRPVSFSGRKVILAIGSPPKQPLHRRTNAFFGSNVCLIEDIYDPNLDDNIELINTCLKKANDTDKNNLLIVGSNASALEVLYNLKQRLTLPNAIPQVYVLSPDGLFPNRINEDSKAVNYTAAHLAALKNKKSYTAHQLLEAVKRDTGIAHEHGVEISDIYQSMSTLIIELLNALKAVEQEKFVVKYGVEIGKFQRRAGREYLDVVNSLRSKNSIDFIKGKFVKLIPKTNGEFEFTYRDKNTGREKTFPEQIKIAINCIGFQNLSDSVSLIKRLVDQKICQINGSNRGFLINENFESSENFYVIGPLVAGNMNCRLRVWHAESCARIFFLSKQLAEVLIR